LAKFSRAISSSSLRTYDVSASGRGSPGRRGMSGSFGVENRESSGWGISGDWGILSDCDTGNSSKRPCRSTVEVDCDNGPGSSTSNSILPMLNRSPGVNSASVNVRPLSRVSGAHRRITVRAAPRKIRQCNGLTPLARSRNVHCGPEPIVHFDDRNRTICPWRVDPQTRNTNSSDEVLGSEVTARLLSTTILPPEKGQRC